MRKEYRKDDDKGIATRLPLPRLFPEDAGIREVTLLTAVMRHPSTNRATVFQIVNNNDFAMRRELSLIKKHD